MGLEEISGEDLKEIARLFIREEGSIAFILYLGKTGLTPRNEMIQELNMGSSKYDCLISTYKDLGLVEGDDKIDLTEKGKILYDRIESRLKEAKR